MMGNGLHPDEATKETSKKKHTVKHSLHPKNPTKDHPAAKLFTIFTPAGCKEEFWGFEMRPT